MTDAGSEFQTDGAAHRKERFAKSVRANGWMSSGVVEEHIAYFSAGADRLFKLAQAN